MEVIGRTKEKLLIEASLAEVAEILGAVTGKKPEKIEIGQKIPAIDYASTIVKIKSLSDNFYYKQLLIKSQEFQNEVKSLSETVRKAASIEI